MVGAVVWSVNQCQHISSAYLNCMQRTVASISAVRCRMGTGQLSGGPGSCSQLKATMGYTGNNEEILTIDVKHLQFTEKFPRDEIKSRRSWYIFNQIQMKDNNK